MRPLGNEKHISLSRKWTKAMRKAGKAKGRQSVKRELKKGETNGRAYGRSRRNLRNG